MSSRWSKKTFDALGLTEYPPGSNLGRLGQQRVLVTRPGFDNIGEILTSMSVEFEPFQGGFDCNLLFINCGTPDVIDPRALADFVRGGGCVDASDHMDDLVAQAFLAFLTLPVMSAFAVGSLPMCSIRNSVA